MDDLNKFQLKIRMESNKKENIRKSSHHGHKTHTLIVASNTQNDEEFQNSLFIHKYFYANDPLVLLPLEKK